MTANIYFSKVNIYYYTNVSKVSLKNTNKEIGFDRSSYIYINTNVTHAQLHRYYCVCNVRDIDY